MPMLPLMTPTPHADASRKITAPGGYESWRFDASSDDGKLHLVAALHFGHALDGRYLRRYALYRRFPTRVAPPVPAEFCAVTFALLEKGRPALHFAASARATMDDFYAAHDGRIVRLGASHLNRGGDGVLRLHLRGTYYDRTIAVNLSFRPQLHINCEIDLAAGAAGREGASGNGDGFAAAAGELTSPRVETARIGNPSDLESVIDASPAQSASANASPPPAGRHGWVVVNPLCDVDGEVSLFESETGGPPRVTPFAGVGCHDHRYGTRPLGELAERWVYGRAVFDDRAILFQQVGDASFVCRMRVNDPSPRVSGGDAAVKVVESGTSRWGIGYPENVELPGNVRLLRPRVVGSSLTTVTIAYDAVGELETGRALVQVVKPRRLLWAPW